MLIEITHCNDGGLIVRGQHEGQPIEALLLSYDDKGVLSQWLADTYSDERKPGDRLIINSQGCHEVCS